MVAIRLMPIDWPTLTAALMAGLAGGLHCAGMCGGIATGISSAGPAGDWRYVVEPNLGRVLGYVSAGLVAGAFGGAIVSVVRIELLSAVMRVGIGLLLVFAGLRLLGRLSSPGIAARASAGFWSLLRPLQRRLLPARTRFRRLALGVLWGWLPCGLSTTVLAAAWLQADVRNGALTMAAFGIGTLPTMLPLSWSGTRVHGWLSRSAGRKGAAGLIISAGAITLAAPWLMHMPALVPWLTALGCVPTGLR